MALGLETLNLLCELNLRELTARRRRPADADPPPEGAGAAQQGQPRRITASPRTI